MFDVKFLFKFEDVVVEIRIEGIEIVEINIGMGSNLIVVVIRFDIIFMYVSGWCGSWGCDGVGVVI